MLFNILLTLNICTFLFFIVLLFFINTGIDNDDMNCDDQYTTKDSFQNKKKYVTNLDHIDSVKSKYYILKGNKDEKSLINKIKLIHNEITK